MKLPGLSPKTTPKSHKKHFFVKALIYQVNIEPWELHASHG